MPKNLKKISFASSLSLAISEKWLGSSSSMTQIIFKSIFEITAKSTCDLSILDFTEYGKNHFFVFRKFAKSQTRTLVKIITGLSAKYSVKRRKKNHSERVLNILLDESNNRIFANLFEIIQVLFLSDIFYRLFHTKNTPKPQKIKK